ncbi:aconitase family protein [Hydrogenophaga sp.]|uniref:3-isopropylmalate dehydratase large subunit n=1 Tax=Hydrogenophaga sp. TaxID=1904254 RepID=UPI002717CA92|nr:aconitase family protein [Hydrogenophaga sp.]MDO9437180.1 aconitase family protein [Hydrogenophaga sp.]
MAMTMTEKLLARAVGRDSVKPGDVISPEPELVILHDGYVETAHKILSELGYKRIANHDRTMIITDHNTIQTTPRSIEQSRNNRRIAGEWKVGHFYDVGRGGHGHIYPMEAGLVKPGMFIFAYDMHCTNFGAVGALALRCGPDVPMVLATGTMWTVVPETLYIELVGSFGPGVHARDLGFKLSADLTSGKLGLEFDDRTVEFGGDAVEAMPIAERIALCNTLTEIGVNSVIFPPKSYDGAAPDASWVRSDPDARYENRLTLRLDELVPQVALPGGPDRAADVTEAAGRDIDHAFLGSCGSGMYEDFVLAARVLKGHRVADRVRLLVVPGTIETARRMADSGLTQQFMDAGAILLPPGCGPCAGGVGGPMGPGEVSISTAATNGSGRMGSKESECYLASPITVTASAIAGRIVDPREAMALATH